MASMTRDFDWSATDLGPPASWPQSLKAAVRIVLTSRYAMWMAWGPNLRFFCNDAYLPTVGIKRDWVLGSRSDKVWEEIWPDIGPRIKRVLNTGEATWDEGLLLFLERLGFPEETYHTFSYSPLADDDGRISGMLCVVTEETERVVGERRLATLGQLAGLLASARAESEVLAAIKEGIDAANRDLPFALLYLYDEQGALRLARASGIESGHPASPAVILPGRSVALRYPGLGKPDREQSVRCHRRSFCQADSGTNHPPGRRYSDRHQGTGKAGRLHYFRRSIPTGNTMKPTPASSNFWPADFRQPRRRARFRGRAPARRCAGGNRPGEDAVLLQRQSRIPHAADVDARSGRGRAERLSASALRSGTTPAPRRRAAQFTAVAQAGEHAA